MLNDNFHFAVFLNSFNVRAILSLKKKIKSFNKIKVTLKEDKYKMKILINRNPTFSFLSLSLSLSLSFVL